MSLPRNRSTSVRKVARRTPKGRSAVHYARRVSSNIHTCALTGERLQAVNSHPGKAKSTRRPNRKFGGALTSKMSSHIITLASRVKEGKMQISDVDVSLVPYVKGLLQKK
jgi:ribosomal protein L34E